MRDIEYSRSGEHNVDRERLLQLIRTLLDRGANPNARTAEVPPTRRFLMGLGDLSWVDFTGQTPFLRAALSGDLTVMKLLLEKGADPNIPTFAGTTALMAACRHQLGGRANLHRGSGDAARSSEAVSRKGCRRQRCELHGP